MWRVGGCGCESVSVCVCVLLIKPQCTSSSVVVTVHRYTSAAVETVKPVASLGVSDHGQWKISTPINFHSASKENQQIILKIYFRASSSS